MRTNLKQTDTILSSSMQQREDKNKQMKAFVANLMAKKVVRRTSENN